MRVGPAAPRTVIMAAVVLAGCVAPAPTVSQSPGPTESTLVSGASSPASGRASPSATPAATLDLDLLPRIELGRERLTAVCDPEPSQRVPDAGDAILSCSDALERGLRALRASSDGPVDRLYFQRPFCTSVPCSEDELSTGLVTGWTGDQARTVAVDGRLHTVAAPEIVADANWPPPGPYTEPPVSRLPIDGAPATVANRTPYPNCGQATMGEPPRIVGCFRAAVLLGRRSEMSEDVVGTEGGQILWLYRYDVDNPVTRFQRAGGAWTVQPGALLLGVDAASWNFDPWTDGSVIPK